MVATDRGPALLQMEEALQHARIMAEEAGRAIV
jgi:hypothetical protein